MPQRCLESQEFRLLPPPGAMWSMASVQIYLGRRNPSQGRRRSFGPKGRTPRSEGPRVHCAWEWGSETVGFLGRGQRSSPPRGLGDRWEFPQQRGPGDRDGDSGNLKFGATWDFKSHVQKCLIMCTVQVTPRTYRKAKTLRGSAQGAKRYSRSGIFMDGEGAPPGSTPLIDTR